MDEQLTDRHIAVWRINYGLDKANPADAMKWWAANCNNMAPAGAVAALGLALQEIDRLKAELSRAHAGLREVEEWDCRGDTLKEAYDSRKGAGAWDGLFPTP